MSSTEEHQALKFLTDAAHLLRQEAPTTSAHLMSQRAKLLSQKGFAVPETQRQHICGACGHIMIPGDQGTEVRLSAPRKRRRGRGAQPGNSGRKPAKSPQKKKIIDCGLCHRTTKLRLESTAPAPFSRRKMTVTKSTGDEKPIEALKMTANASSKKRAKNRKAGLQAILSASKSQSTRSPLSLGDFARK